jgi:hypothetical protein
VLVVPLITFLAVAGTIRSEAVSIRVPMAGNWQMENGGEADTHKFFWRAAYDSFDRRAWSPGE